MKDGNCEYVRDYYKIPAEIGRKITFKNKPGIITEDRGNYIGVTFDEDKPGIIYNVHPTDENLKYLDMGKVRKMTKAQKNYQEYLSAKDWFDGTLIEWSNFKKEQKCNSQI